MAFLYSSKLLGVGIDGEKNDHEFKSSMTDKKHILVPL